MPDFLPEKDVEFLRWLRNLAAQIASPAVELPLTAAERTAIQEASAAFEATMEALAQAQTAARAACQVNRQTRQKAMQLVRTVAARVQADRTVTDTQRRAMGLPVRDRTRTPAAVPQTAPMAIVDASQRLRHSLRILDPANGNRRAKPAGAFGCEVWMHMEPPPSMVNGQSGEQRAVSGEQRAVSGEQRAVSGEQRAVSGEQRATNGQQSAVSGQQQTTTSQQPPVNGEQILLGITTNGRFTHEFAGQHAGWTAYYRLRWFNRRGKKGPWSEFASATVSG